MNPKSRSYRRVLESAFHVGFELGGVEQKLFNMRTRTQNSLHIPYSIDLTQYPKELNHQSTRHDILLGNSATATNNHIEVISWISQHKTNFNVCHIPLSYGDSTIQLSVAKHATKKLPTQAHILRDFMAKTDYFAMLESTEYVIMNHCRQQALGNVLWGLATGRTIYLNHVGPIFKACIYHGTAYQVYGVTRTHPSFANHNSGEKPKPNEIRFFLSKQYLNALRFDRINRQMENSCMTSPHNLSSGATVF